MFFVNRRRLALCSPGGVIKMEGMIALLMEIMVI